MLKKPNKVLIGKDISRTADLSGFPNAASNNLAAGEIVVLDKNKQILSAGATIADTDTIYIAQGTGYTYDYTNPQGTAVTGVRDIVYSEPIVAGKVKKYLGRSYSAKSEQVIGFDLNGLTPTVGREYILHIVYEDTYVNNHPGQFTQTYRYIASSTTLDTEMAALVAKVQAHSGRRINATYTSGTDVITLTGRAIPACTTGLTDIDKFEMVKFDAALLYVDSDGNWQTVVAPSLNDAATVTSAIATGEGNWEKVRDDEKTNWGYQGINNRTHFPVITPDIQTVKDETYDQIIIESSIPYQSPDNSYVKDTNVRTKFYVPVPATSNQMTDILAVLNPWMESAGFTSVSV